MKNKVDSISLNDDFWIQFKRHLISFRFKGMPKGIHFTIGFDKRSTDVNFHITNNYSNPKDKPQIKIVLIDKQHLEEITPYLSMSLFSLVLKPFDLYDIIGRDKNKINFIPFSDLETPDFSSKIEHGIIESFKEVYYFKRKTRLKLKGDVGKQLESFAGSEDLQELISEKIVGLSFLEKNGKDVEGGILLSEHESIPIIRINKDWFKFNFDLTFSEILSAFVEESLVKQLIWNTKRSIIRVKNAKCYADTEEFNRPLRLVQIVKNNN